MSFREYRTEEELLREFKRHMSENQQKFPEYVFNSLVDEAIRSIVFDIHYQAKTGSINVLEGIAEENKTLPENYNADVEKATCPNCDRLVAAARFAPHLEKCMGMGRNSARVSSRRIASRETNYFGGSDDEDDADWSGERKKRKLQKQLASNGLKKNGKSS